MQLIKTTCPGCNDDVFIPPRAITVNENQIDPDVSTYSFTCPECGQAATKPASNVVLHLLRGAQGIRWSVIKIPAELREAKDGPPISLDDMIDLMRDLEKL